MEIVFSLEEITTVARKIVAQEPHKVILFYGEMGAGKTTLIKSLAKVLGVSEATSSPTFSIVNEYQASDELLLYHFDMYRLKNELEAYDMGMEDYLYSGHYCFIEWAQKIPTLIPQQYSTIHIKALANGDRELVLR